MAELPEPLSHTVAAMDAAIVAQARDFDSRGVPMSAAVNECDRAIWYGLRWAAPPEKPEGARQRRFRTGQAYETWMLADLTAAGIAVWTVDDSTGRQFSVELAHGWLRGKVDGVAEGIPEAPKTTHVVECKSHNEKSFKDLVKKGLRDAKPDHFAQCQLYMHGLGLTRCLYVAANKNTDEIHAARVEYDATFCIAIEARIERIVAAKRPPAKAHDDPTSKAAYACAWCPAKLICHEGQFARHNCRTCLHATPQDGANWHCERWDKPLSYQDQQTGCPAHLYIPELVPAEEQIDVDEIAGTVTYRMKDGSIWVDGGDRHVAA